MLAACGSSSGDSASKDSASTTTTPKASTTSAGGTSTGASSTTAASGACATLTAEQEQGPYYYPAAAVRKDVTDGKDGAPMKLALTVIDVNTCTPVTNATVDVWMADALGDYSDTSTGLFLRGLQPTDDDGTATFTAIYPGWYPSRTNHVHVKVHVGATTAKPTSGHVSHTGNLFFPEETSVAVSKVAPYTDNPTKNRVVLTDDFVYKSQNGSGSIMTLTPVDASDPTKGYTASMTLGIDSTATPAGIGIAGTVN